MKAKEGDEYKFGVACVDIFSKYATAFALNGKTPEHFIEALKRVFHKMGGAPSIIMSDEDGSLQSKLVEEFMKIKMSLTL